MKWLIILMACAAAAAPETTQKKSQMANQKLETATLAAGCFWGVEEFYRKMPGVIETRVGFTGGKLANPTYDRVTDGDTGHAESIEIKYDPAKVTFEKLLDQFFKFHDPTTLNRQGNDEGTHYRSAIFFHNEEQRRMAEKFKDKVSRSKAWKAPIVTEITPAKRFYPAEEYHQKYLQKNPGGYDNHFVRKISFD